jgi:4-amino-4-deoxy-L-arabinose transferase-like glycosyltransferase
MRHYALLFLLCLAAFLPGIASLPPIDRDEPRFVQASRQMAESGDYVDIRFQDESRYKKPIGIYWLQNAVLVLSAQGAAAPIWVYRLVSVLAASIAVWATFALGRDLFGKREGVIAAIALIGIFGIAFEARVAKTDAALLAAVVVAQGALARLYLASGRGEPAPVSAFWQFWIATALGILIKGPIGPLIAVLTAASLTVIDRDRRWLRALKPLPGIAILAVITAPWIVAISMKVGWDFWQESVGKDMLGKVTGGQESHGFPPGYYVLTYSLFLWPFGALALEGGLAALNRFRSDPRLRFLLAWYLPWWLACELLPTKLPHYVLPAYPALLLAMAWFLLAPSSEAGAWARWQIWLVRLARLGIVVATLGLAALAIGLPLYFGTFEPWALPCAGAALVAGWFGLGIGQPVEPLRRIAAASIASVLTIAPLAARVLPAVDAIWPSRQIAEAFVANRPCPNSRLISAGYLEPSLVFLVGTSTLLTTGDVAGKRLRSDACALAAIEKSNQPAFDAAFSDATHKPVSLGTIFGVNYSNARQVAITLYRRPSD